jgi:PPOX class probable F420-dependent enzyme
MEESVRKLFGEGRNFACLATVMEDGAPHATTIWTAVEADHIVFLTSPSSRKGRNIAHDARVAFAIFDREQPYLTARVRGQVVEIRDGDAATKAIDAISRRYTGDPWAEPSSRLYVVDVRHEEYDELPFSL